MIFFTIFKKRKLLVAKTWNPGPWKHFLRDYRFRRSKIILWVSEFNYFHMLSFSTSVSQPSCSEIRQHSEFITAEKKNCLAKPSSIIRKSQLL